MDYWLFKNLDAFLIVIATTTPNAFFFYFMDIKSLIFKKIYQNLTSTSPAYAPNGKTKKKKFTNVFPPSPQTWKITNVFLPPPSLLTPLVCV